MFPFNTCRPNLTLLQCYELRSNLMTSKVKVSSKFQFDVMRLIAETLSAVDEISAFETAWLSNKHIFSEFR